jgi:two-component system response regulator AlgR
MNLKVIIVDDEPPARDRLRSMLVESGEFDVVGEAGNGGQALDLVDRLLPDIVLLDVRMPGIDGLEVARQLSHLPEPPAVIFTTAFDEYALQAFDSQAVAYLLTAPISGYAGATDSSSSRSRKCCASTPIRNTPR